LSIAYEGFANFNLYVMKFLGHRNVKNILIYIDLEIACYPNTNDHYVSKVAKPNKKYAAA
jgi:hypothetical protein